MTRVSKIKEHSSPNQPASIQLPPPPCVRVEMLTSDDDVDEISSFAHNLNKWRTFVCFNETRILLKESQNFKCSRPFIYYLSAFWYSFGRSSFWLAGGWMAFYGNERCSLAPSLSLCKSQSVPRRLRSLVNCGIAKRKNAERE